MNTLTARGLSLGLVVAVWSLISDYGKVPLSLWAVVVALACFLASGGGIPGLQRTVAGTVSGVVWALLVYTVAASLGRQPIVYALILGAAVFLMVFQQRLPLLSYTAGAVAGAGVSLGLRVTTLQGGIRVAVALAVGAGLGYAGEWVTGRLKTRGA
jgi:hypothetical protein